jgi:peptidoglycan hydrolase-like protein with peptidoglycan-binding domain
VPDQGRQTPEASAAQAAEREGAPPQAGAGPAGRERRLAMAVRGPVSAATSTPPTGPRGVYAVSPAARDDALAGLLARAVSERALARQATAQQLPPMPLTNDPLTGTTSGDVLTPAASHRQLSSGLDGDDVEFLQGRLNQDGADPQLAVDGRFRGGTRTAVLEFQRRHGLQPDGIVGPQTWGLLDELARAGIAGAHDVMGETQAVTQDEATAIAAAMGSAAPAGPPMVVPGYETEIIAALDAYYDREHAELTPTAITSIAHAARIRTVAERLMDDFYSDHIIMASRAGGLRIYHPGSFVLPVADAATRPVDPVFARQWVELDMLPREPDPDSRPAPADVSQAHHVDTRRPADQGLVRQIADRYLQSGRLAKVIRHIRTYPAEVSSGTAFLGLRSAGWLGDGAPPPITPSVLRRAMWDMLSALMHEYLHKAAHEHFSDTAERMGGQARRVLIEGFCDYFRVQAWDALEPRFHSDAALRAEVEGPHGQAPNGTQLPLDPDAIVPHGTYDELANARQIVQDLGGDRRAEANVRAAYFMGHVDLLGIGHATTGEHAAGSLGTWDPADAATDDLYVVPAGGELVSDVWERTGSLTVQVEGGLFFGPAAATTRVAAGTRLRVRDIRHVRATSNDTRGQIAGQNGVTLRALERANHWSPGLGSTPVPAGTLVLVPKH